MPLKSLLWAKLIIKLLMLRILYLFIYQIRCSDIYSPHSFYFTNQSQKSLNVCFYNNNISKCPIFIDKNLRFGKNNYNSELFSSSQTNVNIYVAENIFLSQPLLITAPVQFFIKNKTINGKIEIGFQTYVEIEDSTQTDFILYWSVNSKKISKLFSNSNSKSIYIQLYDQNYFDSPYEIQFFRGKCKNIILSKSKYQLNNKFLYFSIKNNNNYDYIAQILSNETQISVFQNNSKLIMKQANYNGTVGENVNYTFDGSCMTIFGEGNMSDYKYPKDVPWYDYKDKITSLIVKEGVTSIGEHNFYVCKNIANLTLPESLLYIGSYSFSSCYKLTELKLPSKLISIGKSAFSDCNRLISITIPDNVIIIERMSFSSCISLSSIFIPSSVLFINAPFLDRCKSLTSIIIDENNKNFKVINNIIFSKDEKTLISYPYNTNETSYNVPDCVTTIGQSAFMFCDKLINVNLPKTIISIGESAFYNCNFLKSVSINSNITMLNSHIFESCYKLESVNLPDSIIEIKNRVFAECRGITSIKLPDSCTYIGVNAFCGCYGIKSLKIPSSVTKIDNYAFESCRFISLVIPDSCTQIGKAVFEFCSNVQTIKIPDSIKRIEPYTFCYCSSLKYAPIPSSLEYIGECAFEGCRFIKTVVLPSKVSTIENEAFSGCRSLNTIVIPSLVDFLSSSVFNNCKNLSTISFLGSRDIESFEFKTCPTIYVSYQYRDQVFCGCQVTRGLPDITQEPIEIITEEPTESPSQIIEQTMIPSSYINSIILTQSTKIIDSIEPTKQTITDIKTYESSIQPTQQIMSVIYSIEPTKPISNIVNIDINDDKYISSNENHTIIDLLPNNFPLDGEINQILFEINLPNEVEKVSIPKTDKRIQITIPQKDVEINAYKSETPLILNCPKGANLIIPEENNIILKGNGSITIDTSLKNKSIEIQKIIFENNKGKSVLDSKEATTLDINEIQVVNKQEIIGQKEPKITKCNLINVEEESKLSIKQMTVQNITIGLNSFVKITDDSVNVLHFIVHYDEHQNEEKIVPLEFISPFPNLENSDIKLEKKVNKLQNNVDELIISKFIGNDSIENYEACKKFSYILNDEFDKSECVKEENAANLLVSKSKNDGKKKGDKLSAGEIAGIIIAIVAVIAIIVTIIIIIKRKKSKEETFECEYSDSVGL